MISDTFSESMKGWRMLWIIPVGACVCVNRDIQMCGHAGTCYTQQMRKWELLIHVMVAAIMTDDCNLSESKFFSLQFYLCQGTRLCDIQRFFVYWQTARNDMSGF